MREREQQPAAEAPKRRAPSRLSVAGAPGRALALQRLAGNRAAARVLSRWAVHPDKEKKGVMVPDSAAEDYNRFNPPQNA